MGDEEWVKVATVDDTVVAELLVRLKQVEHLTPPPPPPPPGPTSKPALSLEWSVRQRRSKAVVVQASKQAPRASPTTPLSWSGATSLSGGGGSGSGGSFDGGPEEESGRPKRPDTSRSKVRIWITLRISLPHYFFITKSRLSLRRRRRWVAVAVGVADEWHS